MHIERLILQNFRCFGPAATTIELLPNLTAFVGLNGAGKTATMQALQRMFGVTTEQRRVRKQDFHVPSEEAGVPQQRTFSITAVFAFPELDDDNADHSAVPEFFQQAVSDENGQLKCVMRLDGLFEDDGTTEGAAGAKMTVLPSLTGGEDEPYELRPAERSRIQLIYVPASRDGASQITSFLKGRLWRAVNWSDSVREEFGRSSVALNSAFREEEAVKKVSNSVTTRWQELHSGGTFTTPLFNPVDSQFEDFIRKVEVLFHPDPTGRDRGIEELSDGQRSLFHLALTSASLDIERSIAEDPRQVDFKANTIAFPALTIIAVEEPENNLAPFYLSRIVRQIEILTAGTRAQAMVSSHSASILSRVEPTDVRHFRLEADRTAVVSRITLPTDDELASKYIREAVRAYPELYFARLVILGEGASEEVVLPRLAEAMKMDFDRSFVCTVPLGGRHVNHLWRLLSDLKIPYKTLLDLDWGRHGGGWGRIKQTIIELLAVGTTTQDLFGRTMTSDEVGSHLATFNSASIDTANLASWLNLLKTKGVFFCQPLDLDFSMLSKWPNAYKTLPDGLRGPRPDDDPRSAVLGDSGNHAAYNATYDDLLRWYRYLFLGRGKPSTHMRVLSTLTNEQLVESIPPELRELMNAIQLALSPPTAAAPVPAILPTPTA